MTADQFIGLTSMVRDLGITGLLLATLLGGARQWWVWGWTYRELRRERDEWRSLALGGTDLAGRAMTIADARLRAP